MDNSIKTALTPMSHSEKGNGPLPFFSVASNILQSISSKGWHEKHFCNHRSYKVLHEAMTLYYRKSLPTW